jgi:putative ABC transport system permease protein
LAERYAQRLIFLADGKLVSDEAKLGRRRWSGNGATATMKLPDLAELALRNLRESVLRNSLTTIGISVGVASLVAMLSLGIGLQQLASRRLMKSGLFDTVVVTPGATCATSIAKKSAVGLRPAKAAFWTSPRDRKSSICPTCLRPILTSAFITELRYEDKPHLTMVAALPSSAKSNDAFDALQGHFFPPTRRPKRCHSENLRRRTAGQDSEAWRRRNQRGGLAAPLLGKELTMRYAQREAAQPPATGADERKRRWRPGLGERRLFRGLARKKLKIVGVADLDPESMRGPTRARVFLPLKLAESLHVMQPTDLREISRAASDQPVYSSVSVRVKNPSQVQTVEDAIKKMGFNTFSILDASRSIQQFFKVLDVFLGIFGSLALAVASIGIVNTLVMAILERRREIGIMKAIGASDGDVKRLFFAEAGAMGLLGGMCRGRARLGDRPGHQPGNQRLSQASVFSAGAFLVGAVVAGRYSP